MERIFGMLIACALATVAVSQASADPVENFYKGKTVNIIVGYGAGGGYDVYARLFARFFSQYIPGKPTVVVQNMTGAGSLVAANNLFLAAPKDGTVLGTFDSGLVLMAILKSNPAVKFDPRKFNWLGSISSFVDDAFLMMVEDDAGIKTVDSARVTGEPKLVAGVTADGARDKEMARFARDVLGVNLKLVSGYPDANSVALALDRKEVNAHFVGLSAINTSRPAWVQPGSTIHPVIQFARKTRHPQFPAVPTAREVAPDHEALEMVELIELPYQLLRPFALPPDTPPERVQALQAAFKNVMDNPDFRAEAEKLKLDVSPIYGDEILKLISELEEFPPAIKQRMKALQAGGEK